MKFLKPISEYRHPVRHPLFPWFFTGLTLLLSSIAMARQDGVQQRWNELSVAQAQSAMAAGELNAQRLTQFYLQRIAMLDSRGPQLRSMLELNPQALAQARRLDEERAAGQVRSPLHGIPVVLKANIATNNDMATTAGSMALSNFKASRDAELVTQLRSAGAVILGKANLSEWANFRSRSSSSGWSSLGGQTRNPYVLNRTPCGSSSGSGVAVSANLSLLAVGTETNGSITCPAAMNGVAGIKPTWSSVSGDGIIPIATSQDTAGPLARSVPDAAALLQAMLTAEASKRLGQDLYEYTKTQTRDSTQTLDDVRIGLVTVHAEDSPSVHTVLKRAQEIAGAHGVEFVELTQWSVPQPAYDDSYQVLLYEFKRDVNAWLKEFEYPNGLHELSDVIAFNRRHGEQVMAVFGQEYMLSAQAIDLEQEQAAWKLARQRSRKTAQLMIDRALEEHQLEAILLPAYSLPWLIDHVNGDRFTFGTSSAAAIAGYPSVTFPGGFAKELPVGLSLIGTGWNDRRIIGLAAALEQAINARREPRFIPSLETQHSAPPQPVVTQPSEPRTGTDG